MSTLHFLQEPDKFVQESQILQICYNVDHFLQDSDNIFAKNAFFFARSSCKKCDVLFRPKFFEAENAKKMKDSKNAFSYKILEEFLYEFC